MTAQAGDTTSNSSSLALLRAKAQQRSLLRARRSSLPPSDRRRAAARTALALVRAVRRWQARHVAIYLGMKDELDTAPAIEALTALGCTLYVPVIGANRTLRFARLAPPFKRNRYGILEPRVTRPAPRLDLVVLPLVAFDAAGRRLGMGGGYYDRALAQRPRLRRLGYAYSAQEVARVAADAHDLRLDAVVTESGLRLFC